MDARTQAHIATIAEFAELHAQRAELARQRDVLRACLKDMVPQLRMADQRLGLSNQVSLENKALNAMYRADTVNASGPQQ